MQDKAQLLEEAYKRGLLPPDKMALFEELQKRKQTAPEDMRTKLAREMTHEKQYTPPRGFSVGLMDQIHGGAQLLTESLPEGFVKGGNELNNWLVEKGLPLAKIPEGGVSQMVREGEQNYQQSRGQDPGFDWMRMAGNVSSPANLAMGRALPPVSTLGGRMTQGGALGGMFGLSQPVTQGDYWDEKAKQVGYGAVGGAVMPAVMSAGARVIQPKVSKAVKLLRKEGVSITPAQAMGGAYRRAEEGVRSMPLTGDITMAAERNGIESLNRAAINRVLTPLGVRKLKEADEVGFGAIENAWRSASKAYKDILPNMKAELDPVFYKEMKGLSSLTGSMTSAKAKHFKRIMNDVIFRKVEKNGKMHPETMKEIDSELNTFAREMMRDTNFNTRQLGGAIHEARSIFMRAIERQNPKYRKQLRNIDRSYANLLRIENAAARTKDGVFTPTQLRLATKTMDKTLRKRKTSHGKALMQDLAIAGEEVLSNKLPDSGTAMRALINTGGLGLAAFEPSMATIPLALAAPYLPGVRQGVTSLLTRSNPTTEAMADAVRRYSPLFAPVGGGLLNAQQ